jgi:signal transduction histidine kinase/ActR/RegA family two-component response regulator
MQFVSVKRITAMVGSWKKPRRRTASFPALYRQVFEGNPQPMWLFDAASLRVLDVNAAAAAELGLSRQALLSMTLRELFGTAFDAGSDQAVRVAYQVPGGTKIPLEVTTRLLRDTTPLVGLCTVFNLAHRNEYGQRLRAMNQQIVLSGLRDQLDREAAERANTMKDEFLAVISHELRTPLQAMTGWIQLLRTGKLNAADSARALDVIERNTRIQAQLVADLLDVSRAAGGKLTLEVRSLDLRTVAQAAVDSLTAEATRANVRLDAAPFPAVPVIVEGDAIRLEQVIANLLSNALKFTPGGGSVRLMLAVEGAWAHLRVTDTGEGFRGSFLETMFQSFTQEDASSTRAHAGLGLGLMIVQRLVTAHGGRVSAKSGGKGKGATFVVELPLSDKTHVTAPNIPDATASDNLGMDHPLAEVRLLLVDDHADTRDVLRTLFQRVGAEVYDAGSALEALTLLENAKFDVVVSDLDMPLIDGYEFLRLLRSSEGSAHDVPVIALSAHAGASDREHALEAGFCAHAGKPIDTRALVELIAHAAGRSV